MAEAYDNPAAHVVHSIDRCNGANRRRLSEASPLHVHRGHVGHADDQTLARLKPSDRLSPRLSTCLMKQTEAVLLQLLGSDLDRVSIRHLELDARLWHRPVTRPLGCAEARLRGLR